MPLITLAALSTTVSVLNGTFTLGKQFFDIHAAPGEWKQSIERLAVAQGELEIARRLRDQKFPDKTSPALGSNETFLEVQDAIKSLATALVACEKTLKAIRAKKLNIGSKKGSVMVVNRFVWVVGGKSDFKDNYSALNIPHTKLSRAISLLQTLPDVDEAPPPAYRKSAPRDEFLLSPMQERRRRGKSVDLRTKKEAEVATASEQGDAIANRSRSLPPDITTSGESSHNSRKRGKLDTPSDDASNQCDGMGDEFDHVFMERLKRRRQGS